MRSAFGVAFLVCATAAAQTFCDPRLYGARADGRANDTPALQHAIDTCAAKGTARKPGIVVLQGGTFLSAPLTLRSNMTLRIRAGTTLQGSADVNDYPIREDAPWRRVALLHADHVRNLRITGGGTIDGSGPVFLEACTGTSRGGATPAAVADSRVPCWSTSRTQTT